MFAASILICIVVLAVLTCAKHTITMKESLQKGVFESWLHSEQFADEFQKKLENRRKLRDRRLSMGPPQPLKPLPDPFPVAVPAPSSGDDLVEGGDDYSGSSTSSTGSTSSTSSTDSISTASYNGTGNDTTGDSNYGNSSSAYMVGAVAIMGALVLLPLGLVCMAPSVFFPEKSDKDTPDSNYSEVNQEKVGLPVHVEPSPQSQSDGAPLGDHSSPASKMSSPDNHDEQESFLDPEAGFAGNGSDAKTTGGGDVPALNIVSVPSPSSTSSSSWLAIVSNTCGPLIGESFSRSRFGSWTNRSGATSQGTTTSSSGESSVNEEGEDSQASLSQETGALTEQRDRRGSFHRQFTTVSQDSAHTDEDSDGGAQGRLSGDNAHSLSPQTPSKRKVMKSAGADASGHSLIEEDSDHAMSYSASSNPFAGQYQMVGAADTERVSI